MLEHHNSQLTKAAYAQHLAEILAVPKADVKAINLDVETAVAQGLQVFERVGLMRDEILARLPDFDIGNLDRLPGYALALSYANASCVRRGGLDRRTRSMLAETARWRAQFLSDAGAMAKRRLLEPSVLSQYSGKRSHLQKVEDLSRLTELFIQHWDRIDGKTAVTRDELEQAAQLVRTVNETARLQDRQPEARAARKLIRAQAFTLFSGAYDELQRAAAYLRWKDGRGEHLVPPLCNKRTEPSFDANSFVQRYRIDSVRLPSPEVPDDAPTSQGAGEPQPAIYKQAQR